MRSQADSHRRSGAQRLMDAGEGVVHVEQGDHCDVVLDLFASHKSMYGTIATSWKRDAGHFTLEVTIPPNTSALVTLPAKDAAAVTESGRPVKPLRIEPGAAIYEVQSGAYTFASTL